MSDTIHAAHAAAWELAAFSFRYPTQELVWAIESGEWSNAAHELAKALEIELPSDFSGSLSDAHGDRLTTLRVEATRLFVGAPQPAVSPYEGVWRANEEGVRALLFVNPHSMEVERFMRACGLARPQKTNEPIDHVATECELLQHVAMRALSPAMIEDSSLPSEEAMPGGSSRAAYAMFLAEHATKWMPDFTKKVAAESREPFYRDAARFLGVLVG